MKKEASAPQYPTFYVDDSTCDIEGKKHVVLSALTFPDEEKAIADWLGKKQEFRLHPYDEVTWNGRALPLEQRRAFVPLLNNGIGIVVLDDSTKQAAAERLCTQVWQYCHDEKKDGFRLRFDKNIVEDRQRLKSHLRGFYPPCVGLSEHDSDYEELIQYADFLAGAIKLKIDFGLGVRDPNVKVTVDGENPGSREEMELSFYFFAALRYCLWGRVHDFGDGANRNDPRKMVLGRGLVVNSSAGREAVDKAISFIDGDYMGCIH
jgi:Protein of unknown function (DUF3800)